MEKAQSQALGRLIKKLSALRQTLLTEERDLLDTLILGTPPEVEGHAVMAAAKPAAKAEVEGHILKAAAKPAAKAEVEGHAAMAAAKPAAKAEVEGHAVMAAAKPAAMAEVEGHADITAAKPAAKPRVIFQDIRDAITFDGDGNRYVVKP